jgi:hypothetical protein
MAITSQELHAITKIKKEKAKSKAPTVKAPKFTKEAKQRLVPYGNQAPTRRANTAQFI